MRQALLLIRGIGMIAAALVLGGLAYLSYATATPGNGQLLMTGILAILAIMAVLAIPTRQIEDELATGRRSPSDQLQPRFPMSLLFGSGGKMVGSGTIQWSATEGTPTTIHFAEPEVHRMDGDMLDEAKRLAAQGAPIDEICRMIDPDHDRHDPMHQEVFRRMVRAAVEQG